MADVDDDLERLRALGPPDDAWEPPPPGLWARIEQATIGAAPTPDRVEPPTPLGAARRRRSTWFLAAAAAVVAIVVAATLVIRAGGDDDATVMARTPLDALAGAGRGTAELLDDGGDLRLRLQLDGLADIDGYYEVWMIDEAITRLVSLGPLRSDGTYDVPDGVDPTAYPIVDVSIEPLDGNPAHSTNSVLRGTLELS